MRGYYHYFVEGPDDKKVLDTLKTDLRMILPGKVEKFNVVQNKLTKNRLMTSKYPTTVILVFDADAGNIDILRENIDLLRRQKNQIREVICIMQVILIHITNLSSRLKECQFDLSKFWVMQPSNQYKDIMNEAERIKLY